MSHEASEVSVKMGRRVVTGFDREGKSTILIDGPVPAAAISMSPGRLVNWVWKTETVPSPLTEELDPMVTYLARRDWPPKDGVLAGIFQWDPGTGYPMHATQSIDVGFILSGQIELIVENGSTVLNPGDCYVQMGTPHAWRVVGNAPCVFAGFMIAAR